MDRRKGLRHSSDCCPILSKDCAPPRARNAISDDGVQPKTPGSLLWRDPDLRSLPPLLSEFELKKLLHKGFASSVYKVLQLANWHETPV